MACFYDLSKLSAEERIMVETGKRPMCDYCEHSVFFDQINKNNEVEEFIFIKCLIAEVAYRPPKCSAFEYYKNGDEDG
jgi:hypothetical protein